MTERFNILEPELAEKKFDIDDISHPFIDWYKEDKSNYPTATSKGYYDPDNDFLVGESGGFLLNFRFKFINTHLFTRVAAHYTEHGVYTKFIKGTAEYVKFWARERSRRIRGMTAPCGLLPNGEIINVRITGDHYNYLNYGRISRTPTAEEWALQKKQGILKPIDVGGFPRFWDADYWSFKVEEFAIANNFNNAIGKARRKGYTYKKASSSANEVNLFPKVVITFGAHDKDEFLTAPDKLADMAKKDLDWYEINTIWRRGYVSEKLSNIRLGYLETKGGYKEKGYLGSINSVGCATNPSKAIGGKSRKVLLEEAGKFPTIRQVVEAVRSNTESGRISVGYISAFGTGGVKKADWAPFEYLFYNPHSWGAMPFENVWDRDSKFEVCGFFHSNIWALEDLEQQTLDKDGNSNLELALKYDIADKRKAEHTKTLEDWIIYCGQRANSPGEAFSGAVANMFSSPELNDHIKRVEHDPDYKFYLDGMPVQTSEGIRFVSNDQLKAQGNDIHPYITNVPANHEDDKRGCCRLYHSPYMVNGKIPKGLYRIAYDPTGVSKEDGEITDKHSLASLRVRMVPNDITPFRVKNRRGLTCLTFTGRFPTMGEEDRLVYMLCLMYNAEVNVEINRGETKKNFKTWNALNWITRNPVLKLNKYITHAGDSEIGTTLTPGLKLDALGYVKNSLYEHVGVREDGTIILGLHCETDLPTLKAYQRFNGKKTDDRLSVSILEELDNASLIESKRPTNTKQDDTLDLIFNNKQRFKTNNKTFNCIK